MSTVDRAGCVHYLPEVWLVPDTLADLECRHGEIGGCDACELEAEQAALDRELELEVTA